MTEDNRDNDCGDVNSAEEPTPRFRDDAWIGEPAVELKGREAQQMPSWFPAAIVGGIAWAALGIWLSLKAGWPQDYGTVSGFCAYPRACTMVDTILSPELLEHPTVYSVALFAWYLSLAAFLVWAAIGTARKSPGRFVRAVLLVAVGLTILFLSPKSTRRPEEVKEAVNR